MIPWLKRFIKRSPTPGVAAANLPSREFSFAECEIAFLRTNEVGIQGQTIFYRPRLQGSFRPERGRLARFVKQYLIENNLTHFWSTELVDRFRDWLSVTARILDADSNISTSEKLVD